MNLHRTCNLSFLALMAFAAIAAWLTLQSCKHEPFEPVIPDPATTDTTTVLPSHPCDPDSVYFQQDVLPLLVSTCAKSGCHDAATAQKDVILNNYANVINTGDVVPFDPESSKIYEMLVETDLDKKMPPPPNTPLTTEGINLIRKWINQGALDLKCDGGCDTVSVTFATTISPLISKHCLGCHSGPDPQGGLSFETHADLAIVANNGRLYGAVNHESGFTAMPFNGNKLPVCEIEQIRLWIVDGAPDN